MTKRLFILAVIVLMSASNASAQITWNFNDGILTISGNGTIQDYSTSSPAPWFVHRESINKIEIGSGVTIIGTYAFSQCTILSSITIPKNIARIYNYAFADCNSLKKVILEDGGQTLEFAPRSGEHGETVFSGCIIDSLFLGRNSTYRAYSPFHNSSTLKTLAVGDNVSFIGDSFFYGCSKLDSVKLGINIITIGDHAFYNCSALTRIAFPQKVEKLDPYSFAGCGLTAINIPKNIEFIYNYAFADCDKLTNIILEDGGKSLHIADRTTEHGETVFSGCPVENLFLGRNIIFRANSPFYNKTILKTLFIGKDVTDIPNFTFDGCSFLSQITSYNPSPPKIYENTFKYVDINIPVYVPEHSRCLYKATDYWKNFGNIIDGTTYPCDNGIGDTPAVQMQFFPNPAQTEILIKSDLQIEKVEVYSVTGTLLKSERNFKEKISISTLSRGIYFLKVYTEKGIVFGRVVKE